MKNYLLPLMLLMSLPLLAMDSGFRNTGTYLSVSAELGDFEDVKRLLDRGTEANQVDDEDMTALYVACSKGFQDIALLLLDRGADPTIMAGQCPSTPLHNAIKNRMFPVVEAIVKIRALATLPEYSKDAYNHVLTVLCCFSLDRVDRQLPIACRLKILGLDESLCKDIVAIVLSKEGVPLEQKLQAAKSIIGEEAVCKILSEHCLPHLEAFFELKGFMDRSTAPEYAKMEHERDVRPLPEGNWSEEYKEQHSAIYELLRLDTLEERLPVLIRKWFFT